MPVDVAHAPASPVVGGAVFVDAATHLRISDFNSAAGVTLTVSALLMGLDGQVQKVIDTHIPNTDRTVAAKTIPLGVGWLLSVQVVASAGTPRRGQCFVRVELVNGVGSVFLSLGTILQGYVQDTTALAFPLSPIQSSTEGRGVLRSITGTDPAAGVESTETVPTNARWVLHGYRITLATDGTVATRFPSLVVDDGANVLLQNIDTSGQPASRTDNYIWSAFGAYNVPLNTAHAQGWPPAQPLQGGWRLRTSTTAMVAGDNYTAPQLLVEEWIED